MRLVKLLMASVLLVSASVYANADDLGGFARNGFKPSPNNSPNSYKWIKDPTGLAPARKVHRFTIKGGFCTKVGYGGDKRYDDCKWQSVRSQLSENVFGKSVKSQPKQQWYTWSMYLTPDFPLNNKQVNGQYEFAYFHNGQCPHFALSSQTWRDGGLYFSTNIALGDYECKKDAMIKVADLRSMRGKWVTFEAFVDWDVRDGLVQLYIDGKQVLNFKGRTLTAGHEDVNYFNFGIYLCCTEGVDKVVDATALYAGIKSAGSRDKLK